MVVVLTPDFVELLWYICCLLHLLSLLCLALGFLFLLFDLFLLSFFQFFLKLYLCLACQIVNCSMFQFNVYKIYYSICALKLAFGTFLCWCLLLSSYFKNLIFLQLMIFVGVLGIANILDHHAF